MNLQNCRIDDSIDSDWKFFLGDTTGAENAKFNIKNLKAIDLPND